MVHSRFRAARAAAVLLVGLCLAAGSWAFAGSPVDQGALRQQANALLRLGQYEEAIGIFQRISSADPLDVGARKDLMLAYWSAERFDEAKRIALGILDAKPDDPDAVGIVSNARSARNRDLIPALRAKAVAQFQQQKYAESAKIFREIVKLDPPNFLARRDLMWALWRLENYPEAVEAARQVLAVRPHDTEALDVVKTAPTILARKNRESLYREAKQRLDDNQYETAIPLFQQLSKLDARNTAYRHQLLSALIKVGRYQEALEVGRDLTKSVQDDASSWNALARAQIETRQLTAALESYAKSLLLKPDQPQVMVAMARIHVNLRNFEAAERLILGVEVSTALPPNAYPVMGEALFWSNQFIAAWPYWSKAVELFPDAAGCRFYEAWTQSRIPGQEDLARDKMRQLVNEYRDRQALNFLVDDALMSGRVSSAINLLEDWLVDLQPRENLVFRLATLYLSERKWGPLEKLIDRYLAVFPTSQTGQLLKAEAALHDKRFSEAEAACRNALQINPNFQDGYQMLANVLESQGRAKEAAQYMEKAWSLNPTNPPSLLAYAQTLYNAHEQRRAKDLLANWLKENEGSAVVPVLLYHGLTASPKDPMLVYSYHHYAGVFDEHMRALSEAGYTSVTAEQVNSWLRGGQTLPPRPVLITFDDGRTDSLTMADPILQKYGFKAAMMAAAANVDGHPYPPPGYASWRHLKDFQSTGRWEIQSHGDMAHTYIPITPDGVKGLFLINRQWLDSAGRLETTDEWRQRIDRDYADIQAKIQDQLGTKPSAFAYPEGAYGQKDDNSNVPESAEVNQALVKKHYDTAYVQDAFGMNLRSQDRGRMNRVEPNSAWTGPDLIRHLQDNNPFARAYKQLIDWAAWEDRPREAYGWLARLKAGGASAPALLAKEAQIRLYAGDFAAGQAQAQQALSAANFPDLAAALRSATAQGGTFWTPGFSFQHDNSGREYWMFNQSLFLPRRDAAQFHVAHRRAEFAQAGSRRVIDNAVGAGVELNLGLNHRLGLTAMQHFQNGADAFLSGAGKLDSRWSDDLSSRLELGRAPLSNALALSRNITGRYGIIAASWNLGGLWRLLLQEEWTAYSDDNRRAATQAQAERVIYDDDRIVLKGIDRFTYDNTSRFSRDYYTPRSLKMNALGPELSCNVFRRGRLTLRYLPAYADEDGVSSHFTNELQAGLEWRWNGVNSLRPSYTRYDTPSYHADYFSIELTQHF